MAARFAPTFQSIAVADKVLLVLAPASVILYYLITRCLSFCLLHKPSKHASSNERRYAVAALHISIVLLFAAQAIVHIVCALANPGWWAPQSVVIYLLLSIAAYGFMSSALLETPQPVWYPYIGSWTLGLVFETTLLARSSLSSGSSQASYIVFAVQVARVLCLAILTGSGFWLLVERRPDARHGESAPLMADDATTDPAESSAYASAAAKADKTDEENDDWDDDSFEDPERLKEAKKQQHQRLEERGSWFAYLAEHLTVLGPLVWPKGNRKIQACLAIMFINLLLTRAWNVLIPRQLGILTDDLARCAGTGEIPYRSLLLWMLYYYLSGSAGFPLLAMFAEIPTEQYAYKKISKTAFDHVMSLSMDFHSNKNSGEVIAGIEQGQNLYYLLHFMTLTIIPMFLDIGIAVIYVTQLFDIQMAWILAVVGILYTWLGIKVAKWSASKRRVANSAWRLESKIQNESLSNWQTVSHFNRADYECDRYGDALDGVNNSRFKSEIVWRVGAAMQDLITLLGRMAAAFLASYRVSQGQAPVGNFVALMAYWSFIEGPLNMVASSVRQVSQMIIDSERLLQLLQTKATVCDALGAMELAVTKGQVQFDEVDFAYDPRKQTLKDVSFTVEGGQTVALVGETGGGKSTILKLLYRYWDVTGGSIKIDGQDIRHVTLDSLRNSFGMVPQDPSLFNISVLENVRYARLDATDEEVHEACRAAAIHAKIMSFPDGYGATVGERGVKLSGGELQRVAIARAILRNPSIVLLDEATSMIDAETEAVIQTAFRRLSKGRTTFVVAHRLSTIQNADVILVIQDGQIIEKGTHRELFAQKGKYTSLWSRQVSKEAEGAPNA